MKFKTRGFFDQRSGLKTIIYGATLFVIFLSIFTAVQYAAPGLAGNDGYYHIKLAAIMRQHGLTPTFYWLPLSILSPKGYYDHHFLYHVYLLLFVPRNQSSVTPQTLITGAKLASIVLPSAAFLAVWWLLRQQKVPHAAVWSLGLFAVSDAFLYRMSMPRAQSGSLLVLVLGMHFLLHRKKNALFVLGFVYVWLYNAFPLLILVAAAYVIATYITERTFEWQLLASVILGICIGLVVNPYFPQNINFILDHLLPKIGEIKERVGNEWYPYKTWTLVLNSTGALAAAVAGLAALGWSERRINRRTLFAMSLMLGFGFMVLKSRRFVEYFPAFALIFAALSVNRVAVKIPSKARWSLPLLLVVLILLSGWRTVDRARASVEGSKSPDVYADAALWLKENSEPGSLVFQTDWDDFTRLFFYNTSNIYTIGLDVTYMQRYKPELYELWVDISRGKIDTPSQAIATRFGAHYVFSDLKHHDFMAQAEADAALSEVYSDEHAVIYRVEEQP